MSPPPPEIVARILPRLTSPWAAAVVLAVFYGFLLAGTGGKSATMDEPGHASAGYVYWKYGDYRVDPENGNLSKRWIALPFLAGPDQFPQDTWQAWKKNDAWVLADKWFNRMGNDTGAMLARGRAMGGLVAVALGAAVWFWSRRLFGPAGGMLSLLLFTLNPAILANGCLMTSDTPAALGFLLALGGVAANLERITVWRVVAGTVAVAGLFLAKMSAALVLPMAAALAAARVAEGRPLRIGRTRELHGRARQAAALGLVALLHALGAVALVWAAYGFRYSAFSASGPVPHRFEQPWPWALGQQPPRALLDRLDLTPAQRNEFNAVLARNDGPNPPWSYALLEDLGAAARRTLRPEQAAALARAIDAPPTNWVPWIIHMAREHRLLPESFLFGYATVWRTSGGLAAFLNGEIRSTGWWTFFPFTFAVKTPLPFLALLALGLGLAVVVVRRRWARHPREKGSAFWSVVRPALPLLVLLVVYWAAALTSNLNIGHRHLLPVYPPLFVLGGAGARWFTRRDPAETVSEVTVRVARVAVVGFVVALGVETAFRFPNYLAYFNGTVAPSRAYRHLVDSSLDWGQELPAIARYLKAHPDEPAHLAYFGIGRPSFYGITARNIGGFPNVDGKLFPPIRPVFGAFTPADVARFLQEHPDYAPDPVFRLGDEAEPGALFLHRGSVHRLTAGLYVVSASMLQPLYYGKISGYWSPALERLYRHHRQTLAPLLAEDRAAKIAAMPTRSVPEWAALFEEYYDCRLARLTTYLRTREPDDTINHSVLVYRLTEADLARALDGPLP